MLAPLLAGGRLALWGDGDRCASAGRQRISSVEERGDRVRCRVVGAQEVVRLVGWSAAGVPSVELRSGGAAASPAPLRPSATDEVLGGVRFELTVDLPAEPGWIELDITL